MLDLEVVPERSLGCDNWEFILGEHKYDLNYVRPDLWPFKYRVGLCLPVRDSELIMHVCNSARTRLYMSFRILYYKPSIARIKSDPRCVSLSRSSLYYVACALCVQCGE